jgi:ferredoxin
VTDAPGERALKVVSLLLRPPQGDGGSSGGAAARRLPVRLLRLGVGHLEVLLEGVTSFLAAFGRRALLYERFLPAGVTNVYHFSQDLFAAAVLVAAAVGLLRRFLGRPPRLLPRSRDGERILWFLLALYATFFLLSGPSLLLRQRLGSETACACAQPASALVAGALASLPTPEAQGLRGLGFWAHTLVFLGFAAYLPTDEAHAPRVRVAEPLLLPAQALRAAAPGRLREDREVRIERVQELPWKSLLDSFACTECGRCNSVCPAHATGKPLMPMKVLHDVKLNLRDRPQPLVSQAEIVEGQVHVDELWPAPRAAPACRPARC